MKQCKQTHRASHSSNAVQFALGMPAFTHDTMPAVCLVLSLYCREEVDQCPGHAGGEVEGSGLRGHHPEGPPLPLLDAFLSQTSSSAWPAQLPDVSCLHQLASSLLSRSMICSLLVTLSACCVFFSSPHVHVWSFCAVYHVAFNIGWLQIRVMTPQNTTDDFQ